MKTKATIREIDLTNLTAHELLEMFRRGEHKKKNSDAYYLSIATKSALNGEST